MYDRCDFELSCITASVQKYLLATVSILETRHSLSAHIYSIFLRFLSDEAVPVPCYMFPSCTPMWASGHPVNEWTSAFHSVSFLQVNQERQKTPTWRPVTDSPGDVKSSRATQTTGLVSPMASTRVTRAAANPPKKHHTRPADAGVIGRYPQQEMLCK